MIRIILLVFVSELLNTGGQVLFKKGANLLDTPHLKTFDSFLGYVRKVVCLPPIWFGLFLLSMALTVWLFALSEADLSLVFPIGSMQYLLTMVAARVFLNEKIDRVKLLGTIFIVAGIVLIAKS